MPPLAAKPYCCIGEGRGRHRQRAWERAKTTNAGALSPAAAASAPPPHTETAGTHRRPGLHRGPAPQLVELHRLVGEVAGEEQQVAGLDGQRKAHEERRVDAHHRRHVAADQLRRLGRVGQALRRGGWGGGGVEDEDEEGEAGWAGWAGRSSTALAARAGGRWQGRAGSIGGGGNEGGTHSQNKSPVSYWL